MALTHAGGADGFTNLYSSITAEPKIMLSTISDRKIEITINATSANIPRIEETNSNFLHPSALLINCLNSTLGISILNFTLVCFLFPFSYNVFHDPH